MVIDVIIRITATPTRTTVDAVQSVGMTFNQPMPGPEVLITVGTRTVIVGHRVDEAAAAAGTARLPHRVRSLHLLQQQDLGFEHKATLAERSFVSGEERVYSVEIAILLNGVSFG